ncbi:MAG: VOC family protein [Gammaproteobacteria bacterium]
MNKLLLSLVFLAMTSHAKNPAMLDQPVGHTFPSRGVHALPPSQRMHLVLLGVDNVARSTRFFEKLGWTRSPTGNEGFAKFDMGGYAIALINRDDLAKDALEPTSAKGGFAGIALIHLARTPEEVPAILARAAEAGGTIVKPATRTHWGIAGYFKDPDGHLFEVDYEKTWVFDDAHHLVVDKVN